MTDRQTVSMTNANIIDPTPMNNWAGFTISDQSAHIKIRRRERPRRVVCAS